MYNHATVCHRSCELTEVFRFRFKGNDSAEAAFGYAHEIPNRVSIKGATVYEGFVWRNVDSTFREILQPGLRIAQRHDIAVQAKTDLTLKFLAARFVEKFCRSLDQRLVIVELTGKGPEHIRQENLRIFPEHRHETSHIFAAQLYQSLNVVRVCDMKVRDVGFLFVAHISERSDTLGLEVPHGRIPSHFGATEGVHLAADSSPSR